MLNIPIHHYIRAWFFKLVKLQKKKNQICKNITKNNIFSASLSI